MSPEKRILKPDRLGIWGGIECTINRIGNKWQDQLDQSGYYHRKDDLEKILDIGFDAFRFPLLWEKHQPDYGAKVDWSWGQRQLQILKAHKIIPIVGLLHHGSGPKFTSLQDPDFPAKFSQYAGKTAEAFEWVSYYTPLWKSSHPGTVAGLSGGLCTVAWNTMGA